MRVFFRNFDHRANLGLGSLKNALELFRSLASQQSLALADALLMMFLINIMMKVATSPEYAAILNKFKAAIEEYGL